MLDCFIRPYSYHRIKQIFKNDYLLNLERVYIYKGTRHDKFPHYNLVNSDGKIVLGNVTLQALRIYLTKEDYPLN